MLNTLVSRGSTVSWISMVAFPLRLSQRSEEVSVNYATANGSATAGDDYTTMTGTASFAPGETIRTVLVAVAGDDANESDAARGVVHAPR